jgi:hypothetical protein
VTFHYEPAGYGGETVPSGGCTKGAHAENLAWQRFSGLQDDGCYNPRPVRGTGPGTGKPLVWSLHAVGRAVDNRCDSTVPAQKAIGDRWADWLIARWQPLGVQYIIWCRRSWRPDRGWRPYSGVDPHTHHLHVELSRAGAVNPSALWSHDATPPTTGGFLMALTDAQQHQLLDLTTQTALRVAKLEKIVDGTGQTADNPNGAAKGTILGRIRDAVARIEARG